MKRHDDAVCYTTNMLRAPLDLDRQTIYEFNVGFITSFVGLLLVGITMWNKSMVRKMV